MQLSTMRLVLVLSLCLASWARSEGNGYKNFKRQTTVTEPSAPRDLMLVERTNVSLFITWSSPESNGGSTIIDYRVRTENQRTFEIVTQMGLGVVNEYNITDLDPLTTYNVFVAAINSIGRGDEISIEAATLSNGLDGIMNHNLFRSSSARTIRVLWREPDINPLTTAPLLRYQMNVSGGTDMRVLDFTPDEFRITGFHDVEITLMDVLVATQYEMIVVAFNIRGPGAPVLLRVYVPAATPSEPRNIMAIPTGPSSIQLTWDEPANNGGAPIDGYVIDFETPLLPRVSLDADARSYILPLDPLTSFEVLLQAENVDRRTDGVRVEGPLSIPIPGTPAPPTISEISDVSAVVTWTLPGGVPFSFELRYRKTSEDMSSEENCVIDGISDLSKTITDLDPLTSYTVRIRAQNSGGASEFSESTTFTTYGAIEIQATPAGVITIGEVESIVLTCTLEGAGADDGIEYVWTRAQNSLPSSAQTNGNVLTFSEVVPEISGEYICTAQQVVGSHQLMVVADVPGAVSNIRVDADAEMVTLLWDAAPSNGATISSYIVTVLLDSQQVYTGMSVDTSLSVTRNELQDQEDTRRDTEYQVTVSAVNSVGSGEEVTETLTIPSGLPGMVSNIQVQVDGNSVTLRWDAPPNGNDMTTYTIRVLLDGVEVFNTVINQETSVSTTRDNLQGLNANIRLENTDYEVSIVAENQLGPGPAAVATITIPAESAAPPQLTCNNTDVSAASLMVDCQVVSILDASTTCSYDGLPAEPCALQFLINFLDFEPGDHTLFLAVTASDGQADDITITFTTPLRLSVTCNVVGNLLSCESTTEIESQTCSFNGMSQVDCTSPFDIRTLNLALSDHSVTVFITDVFGQTENFAFQFTTIPSTSITLSFTDRRSLFEGTTTDIPFLFRIVGQAVEDIPFSLQSLTYQAYQSMTGQPVSSIFPDAPLAASTSDYNATIMTSFTFSASPDTITTNYGISIEVEEDEDFEDNEGFILYFEFDESQINFIDFSRLETGTRTILITIVDNDALSVTCVRGDDEGTLSVTADCVASRDVVSTTCSIDGQQAEPCEFPIRISVLPPGEHTLTVTVTSGDGQTASDDIVFTRPPFPTANCSVLGTVLSCTTNNEPDSHFCLFDASLGVACSAMIDLVEDIGLQVGSHSVIVFIRDAFSQQVQVELSFTIVSDLQIDCQELNVGVTTGGVDCERTGGIGEVSFTCSIDDEAPEDCGRFPVEIDLFQFTAEEHTLSVVATDAAEQAVSFDYTFIGIPDLVLTCMYSDNILFCESTNQLASQSCAFDGQQATACSFPLEIRLTGLRLGDHIVTVFATDEFTQTDIVSLSFEFTLGGINVSIPTTASVIEGKPFSPVPFSISGQGLSNFSFVLSPLTYPQFESLTGLSVSTLFNEVPRPANLSDFDSSTVTFNFNTAATEVKEDYTYNAVLEDDSDDENVEGFILYFEFMEDQLIPDDFSRLSQTTAVTLVTIIDNDGLKLTCIQTPLSTTTLSVSCNASAEVNATCMYDMEPAELCGDSQALDVQIFEFTINILNYLPGKHSVLVMVTDRDSQVAADTVAFTTPPLPSVMCSVDDNILTCNSNNQISTLLCQFDGGLSMPCSSPLNVLDLGLGIGPHSLVVMITDVFERTRTVEVEFSVESDLMLVCSEVEDEREYVTGIDCSSTGGIGGVSYSCSLDGESAEDCADSFPITFNVFEFSPGEHSLLIRVADSVGGVKTYVHSFMGMIPMDYVIAVNTIRITVNEDGSFRTGSDLEISESGYSFGDVEVTVTPLTYTQYERQTGQDIAETFVRQPTEASVSEFESRVLRFTFRAGLSTEVPIIVRGSTLPIDDSQSEITEGFLLLVEIDTSSLDPRDVGRVSVEDSVILVSILDDNDVEDDSTVALGLSADELTALLAGIVVLILILVTLFLLLIVCLVMWRRRRAGGKGIFRSRNRQSKSSHSSERRIFHAAR